MLHCRFIHIPSKVNPKTAVEEHRERIAAAKIVHAREAQPVACPPKGVQYEDPNQEAVEEEQEEQGVGRMYQNSEDEYQGEAAQGGSGGWQQGGSADLQAGGLGQLVEGLSSAEAREVQASLAAIAQEESSLAGVRQQGLGLPAMAFAQEESNMAGVRQQGLSLLAVKVELPEEAVGEQPLGQKPAGHAPPDQEAMIQEHVGQGAVGQHFGGGGQTEEANDDEDLYRDLYGVKMERVDQEAGLDAHEAARQGSTSSEGQEDWEKEALQDSLFQGGQSSDESDGAGGGARVDAMDTS